MHFSLLDLLIAAGLILAAYFGYKSGAPRKLFTLISILIAILVAARFMHAVGAMLSSAGIASAPAADIAAFLLILVGIIALSIVLFRYLGKKKTFKQSGNALGLVLGVVEGFLVLSIVFWGLRVFDEPGQKLRSTSLLYEPVLGAAPAVFDAVKPFMPGAREFRDLILPGQHTTPDHK